MSAAALLAHQRSHRSRGRAMGDRRNGCTRMQQRRTLGRLLIHALPTSQNAASIVVSPMALTMMVMLPLPLVSKGIFGSGGIFSPEAFLCGVAQRKGC